MIVAASTLWAGCSGGSPNRQTVAAALVATPPAVTQFVLLAEGSATFGDRDAVNGGDVGLTAGTLTSGFDSHLGVGETILAPSVVLKDRAVAGAVDATQVTLGASVVTGSRSTFVAPPVAPTAGTVAAGSAVVTVSPGNTQTLGAGSYGVVTVNGSLNLGGGLYQLKSLQLGPNAQVIALSPTVLRVSGGINASNSVHIHPAAPLAASALRITVAGTVDSQNDSLLWGTDGQLTALVVARGTFTAGDRMVATGAIAAQSLTFGNDASLTFAVGFGCGTGSDCNDGNTCTTDACVDAECSHTTLANGASCSDGNACTLNDACQSGVCIAGPALKCTAEDQCHQAGTCDPTTGACSNPAFPDGTACNDKNACTLTDVCRAGTCVGGSPVICTASDSCHGVGACDPTTGVCPNPTLPDGTNCTDHNACTDSDGCMAGVCTGVTMVTCPAPDSCHQAGTCDPSTGMCNDPVIPSGTGCTALADVVCDPTSGVCVSSPTVNPDGSSSLTIGALNVKGPVTLQGVQPFTCISDGPNKGPAPPGCPAEFGNPKTPRWVSGDGNPNPAIPRLFFPSSTVNFQIGTSFTDDTSTIQVPFEQTDTTETPCQSNSDCLSGVCNLETGPAGEPINSFCAPRTCHNAFYPGALEGNHGFYALDIQRWDTSATTCPDPQPSLDPDYPAVAFDTPSPTGSAAPTPSEIAAAQAAGTTVPAGTGCWVDFATGTSDLFGSSAGSPSATIAQPNGTVQGTLTVPVQLPDVATYLRYVVTVTEGDTRVPWSNTVTGWAPGRGSADAATACSPNAAFTPTNVLCPGTEPDGSLSAFSSFPMCPDHNGSGDFYEITIDHPVVDGQASSFFSYSKALNPFQAVVYPVALAQLKVLPYTIVYTPPGNASTGTYAVSGSYGVTMIVDDKLTNMTTTTVDNKSMNTATFGASDSALTMSMKGDMSPFPATIGISLSDSSSWDTSTKMDVGNISDVATNQSSSLAITQTFPLNASPNSSPGASGTYATEPFWNDYIVLLVHPQIAMWQLSGGPAVSMLAALPGPYIRLAVQDLDTCFRTGVPIPIAAINDSLNSAECHALLQLDPFYGVGQALDPSLGMNPRAVQVPGGVQGYGTTSTGADDPYMYSSANTFSGTTTIATTGSYDATVTDILTTQLGFTANLGAYGITGSDMIQSTETLTNATMWSVQYQTSFAATAQSSVTVTALINDKHTPTPNEDTQEVLIYQDLTFGSLMFQDPNAPRAPAPTDGGTQPDGGIDAH